MSVKKILLFYAPKEDKEELKEFLEVLSTSKTREDYNKIRNKDEYKAIFAKYPEFTEEWQINKKSSPDGKGHNNTYEYNLFLNRKISNMQPKGQILKVLRNITKNPNLEHTQINRELTAYASQQAAKEQEETEQQAKQQHEEELERQKKQSEQRNKEELEKQNAESKAREIDNLAKQKNKTEERIEELEAENKLLREENQYKVNPRLKDYLRDHYIIDSPMTREELFEKVANDPHLLATNENHIKKYVDYILGRQLKRLITSKTKIIKTAKLFGNDAEYLSKLDPMVREAVLKYQTDMINKTITDKNNKYLLPKKYIKFEKAINNYKVNPLILRGLYVK